MRRKRCLAALRSLTVGAVVVLLLGLVANMLLGGIPLLELRRALTPTPPRPQIIRHVAKAGAKRMADSPWCKTTYVTGAGSMWTSTLVMENVDKLLMNVAGGAGAPGAFASVSACGGSASIAPVKCANVSPSGTPAGFDTDEEKAAYNEWRAHAPEWWLGSGVVFLFRATATAGANSDSIYKCFGYITYDQDGTSQWIGDTEWSLPGSLSVTGLNLRQKLSE